MQRVAAYEEAVVYDHVDAVFLRDELGAEALPCAALADERVDADAPYEPEDATDWTEHSAFTIVTRTGRRNAAGATRYFDFGRNNLKSRPCFWTRRAMTRSERPNSRAAPAILPAEALMASTISSRSTASSRWVSVP